MTIFRSRGFDSLIGAGTMVRGALEIQPNSTLQVDGIVISTTIAHSDEGMGDAAGMGLKIAPKTTFHVNGSVEAGDITVHNVIVAGRVKTKFLRVEGTLAIKAGARIDAEQIFYRDMVIETGAIVHGQMFHLDHVSAGETV